MNSKIMLSELPAGCLRFSSKTQLVRIDDDPKEVEQTYLTIQGTPEAYRWLAQQLNSMARSAEQSKNESFKHNVIVAPYDLPQVTLADWSVLELECGRDRS